jgi:membrane-associated phospholipid phosphatase
VQEVAANRTFEQQRGAVWWGTSSPVLLFERWAMELVALTGTSLPQAARIHADVHAAIDDALIAVWDGKFTFWYSRPITEDPELVTALPTPPYPAYPGGYSAVMGAGSVVVGHYFPGASVDMEARAWEAACSRLWAGIHYPMDNDAGLIIGRKVGRAFTSLDRATSSPS